MEKQRILVVDDDDKWLRTVNLILGSRYELDLVTDPCEAVSLVKSSFFALAILDQRISSEVSGISLFTQLRTIQSDLRGIILTGYAELEDGVDSMKIDGVSDYISKGRGDLANQLQVCVENAIHEIDRISISALIAKGESGELEFKSSARWDMRQGKVNREMGLVIIKTVAGFLNSELGGVLLIGVDDSGKVVGLQHDYRTLSKQNRDGFENFLMTLLLDAYGQDVAPLIRIDFHDIQGNEVCRISIRPAFRPVFLREGEQLYIRTANSTHALSTREAIEYCKVRWK